MHTYSQNRESQELIWVLSLNCHRIRKGEDNPTKRQCVHTTANNTVSTTFTANTAAIATTCKAKSAEMQNSRSI